MTDYNAALKIAALRLNGALPTMDEIKSIQGAADDAAKKVAYEALIDKYMSGPAFARQMFAFWQDQMKIGGSAMFDTAPALAAELTVNNSSYMELFTRTTDDLCPTFNAADGTFTPAACGNGGPQVGVLSNPGIMASYFANLAFRRTRQVQEVWNCVAFPLASQNNGPDQNIPGAVAYHGLYPFNRISSPQNNGGRVNFQDRSAADCASCHGNLNHRAPLFGNYDANGKYQTGPAVPVPLEGSPTATMAEWLVAGDSPEWLFGQSTPDLASFGQAMAKDPSIAACGVARIWNWALGKTDIVDALQEVPLETIQDQVNAFTANGFKIKDMIASVYKSKDFTSF